MCDALLCEFRLHGHKGHLRYNWKQETSGGWTTLQNMYLCPVQEKRKKWAPRGTMDVKGWLCDLSAICSRTWALVRRMHAYISLWMPHMWAMLNRVALSWFEYFICFIGSLSLSSELCKLPIFYFHTWRKEVAARHSGALWQDYTSRNLLTTELLECVHSWRARYYNIPLSTSLFKMDWCCFLKRKKCNGIFSHSSSISLGISMSVGLSVVFEIMSEIWNNVSFVVPRG